MSGESLATGQRSMSDPTITYDLSPPLTRGCPETSTESIQYPLEVTYAYDAVDQSLFDAPLRSGLDRWAPLLPPLRDTGLAAGGTPLIRVSPIEEWAGVDGPLYVKDESRNPTWSQKDRLNRVVVSAALAADARGVVASSSGNHGAAAAAHAARAGLDCVVLTSPDTPASMQGFLRAYDAAVLRVEGWDARAGIVDDLAQAGFHPVTSRTETHTGHPYGPEGYKTIAYETFLQLDGMPGTVVVPTAHAELLYGIWKGFRELSAMDIASTTPTMVAAEPDARGPLTAAQERGTEMAEVDAGETAAHSIAATQSTYRGHVALSESDGTAVLVSDEDIAHARDTLAGNGLWQEFSGAAGLAGASALVEKRAAVEAPVVVLATSSGFKDGQRTTVPRTEPNTSSVQAALDDVYNLTI